MSVLSFENVPRQGRKARNPQHRWNVTAKPFAIQPICIAPVIPGETMKSALFQARVVSDPIKNKLIGWWQEYYWFYVKHTDLSGSDDFKDMMLDPDKDMSAYLPTGTAKFYEAAGATYGGINWMTQCYQRIVETYFREEGEAWNVVTIDGLAAAGIATNSWLDSAILSANLPSGTDIDTVDVVTPGDLDPAYRAWQLLMAQQLINMTYEDYLRSFGIRGQAVMANAQMPELIRYTRDWQYPANTVTQGTGAVTSALSWSVSERIDKDRFFPQPGFLVGLTVTRPKLYMSNQRGYLSQFMDRAQDWLPAILRDDPWTSLKEFDDAVGPLGGLTGGAGNDYWVDLRDLLIYGDQFSSNDITVGDGADNDVELPGATLTHAAKNYPTETMVDSLFYADTAEYVRQDGVISFNIMGSQRDNT